jgi:DNA-binding transcriptional LysR family regulator
VKLNDLDLNKLHVFRVVAESSSMREAGERLLRTTSAISQSITSLEKSLGIPLFTRSGIRLELTDAGRRVFRHVTESEHGLSNLLDELRGTPSLVRGRVTLGMPPGYPAVSLAEGLSAALLNHPELQLRVRFLSHAELAGGLQRGELEMALSLQPLRAWNRRIQSVDLREDHLILAVPPRYRTLCSGELRELPVVDYYQKPLLIESWLKHHRQKRVKTRIRVFGSNLDHVLQLVFHGVGCAVVPRHVVEAELATGTLIEHSFDRRRPWFVSVWLNVWGSSDRMTLGARSVWDALLRSV